MKIILKLSDAMHIMDGIAFTLVRMGIHDLDILEKKTRDIFLDYCKLEGIVDIEDDIKDKELLLN